MIPTHCPLAVWGTLDHIDDAGQFHVKWDNGSGLALIIGEDRFQVQLPEPSDAEVLYASHRSTLRS